MLKGFIGMLGRMCLSLIFIASGLEKILNYDEAFQSLHASVTQWMIPGHWMNWAQNGLEIILPYLSWILSGAIFLELLGAACVLLGFKVRFGAFLLIVFLVPVTLLMHPFWAVQGGEYEAQVATFLRNLSIIGGLLILLAYGKGGNDHSSKHVQSAPK